MIAFVGPNYAINPTLYDKLPFNFIRDSAPPVAGGAPGSGAAAKRKRVPANNVAEFIARRKRDDPVYRPRRIGVRPCNPRRDRERGSADGQVQKLSAGEFHFSLSRALTRSPRRQR
jgi:hypothetical protein